MDGSISEDCSLGPESLTMGLPGEGASDLLQVLLNENRLLKGIILIASLYLNKI